MGRLGFSEQVAAPTLLSCLVFNYGQRALHETRRQGEWRDKGRAATQRADTKGFYSSDV